MRITSLARSASREGGDGKTQAEAIRLDDLVLSDTKASGHHEQSGNFVSTRFGYSNSYHTSGAFLGRSKDDHVLVRNQLFHTVSLFYFAWIGIAS